MRIAHIINPVKVNKSSDLYVAQPITFESLRIARDFAVSTIDVSLFTAQYQQDRSIIPNYFSITNDLNRSILDIGTFRVQRQLPFIADILQRLYDNSDTDYFIYSNIDITVMPNFYLTIKKYIDFGHDGFVINRRTIPAVYSKVSDLPKIYAEVGVPHGGYDCFVFKRELLTKFSLGNVCIGVPNIGLVIAANIAYFAEQFMEFDSVHLTCHLGDDRGWKNANFGDYCRFNTEEGHRVVRNLWTREKLATPPSCAGPLLNQYFNFLKSLP